MPRLLILILITSLCASCSVRMNSAMHAEAERADVWGPEPRNPRGIVDQAAGHWFVDPGSLSQVKLYKTERRTVFRPRNLGEPPMAWFGYVVPFEANAKNRLGGYTGKKMWAAYWREGVIYDLREYRDDPSTTLPHVGGSLKHYHVWRDGKWVAP